MADFEAMTEAEEKNFIRFEQFRDQQLLLMLRLLRAKATVTLVDAVTSYGRGEDRDAFLLQAQLLRSKAEALEVQPGVTGAMKYAGHQMLLSLTSLNLNGED